MKTPKPNFPSDAAFARAARLLGCEEKMIRAVAHVEAGPGGAFYLTGEPVLLFERHVFRRLTDGKYDYDAPDLSCVAPGGYGRSQDQPARLQRAALLDHDAAIMATSWGLFQIMGGNYQAAGFNTLQAFVDAMYRSVDDHLHAFVAFISASAALLDAIRTKNFLAFALHYNGIGEHDYHERLRVAYEGL